MKRAILFLTVIVSIVMLISLAEARTILVPEDYNYIQVAIDSASYGDTVSVGPGIYSPSTSGESFPIVMKNGVKLLSRDEPINTIIDAEQTNSVFQCISVDKNTKIGGLTVDKGFTIRHGVAINGGGLYCENSSLIIEGNVISENRAEGSGAKGGGIYCISCDSIQVNANTITGNDVYSSNSWGNTYGGAIFYASSSGPKTIGNYITGNTSIEAGPFSSYSYGAGIYCSASSLEIEDNVIMNNYVSGPSGGYGGGIYCTSATEATIQRNVIQSNTASHEGGGVYVKSSAGLRSPFEIVHNKIYGNSANVGAGIRCDDASPDITDNLIAENTANDMGGGISSSQSGSSIMGNTIIDNTSEMGGGIQCEQSTGMPEISNNAILNNHGSEGAGIYLSSSSPWMQANTLYENLAIQRGGAVWVSNSVSWITGNKIIDNLAPTGGAFYATGSQLPLINCSSDDLKNDIYSNGASCIYNASTSELCAEYNWWGSSPPDTSCFYGPINYEPWSDTPGYPVCVLLLPENTSLSGGDSLIYEVKLLNETDSPQTFDAWTEVILPNGSTYPLFGPIEVTRSGDSELTYRMANYIPPLAPAGLYLYTAKIGTYPSQVTDSSWFHFYIE